MNASMTPRKASGLSMRCGIIIVVMLPYCGPDRHPSAQGSVGTVPGNRWTPDTLSVARMLSLQGRPHVRTASRASSVALPLPPAISSGLPPETLGYPAVCAWSRLAEARAVAPADAHAHRHAAH